MAVSGMEIFKMLPRTNCRDCKSPSCLAFAMKVAGGKAQFDECPHLSEDSRQKLEGLMSPPIKTVQIKKGQREILLGGEKVIFRHDESFYHPTAFSVLIPSGLDEAELAKALREIESLQFERAGEKIFIDAVALDDDGSPPDEWINYAAFIHENSFLPLAVRIKRGGIAQKLLERTGKDGVLFYLDEEAAKEWDQSPPDNPGLYPVTALPASNIESALALGEKFSTRGWKNALIAIKSSSPAGILEALTSIRHGALKGNIRNLGYPALLWPQTQDTDLSNVLAAVTRYGSMVALRTRVPHEILPCLTLRQNVFTDPRRPIQVEAKLYRFGDVNPDSPALVTTNFSLTYFTVAQEIEASRTPAYLLVIDTDGTSVLTAWASDRFGEKDILKGIEKSDLSSMISHRNIIIPGYVATLKEEIEGNSSWKVIVGPREASGIPRMMRSLFKAG